MGFFRYLPELGPESEWVPQESILWQEDAYSRVGQSYDSMSSGIVHRSTYYF